MSTCLIDFLEHNKELPEMGVDYPFSEFDAAVFSWLVYFPLTYVPKINSSNPRISLKDYCEWTLRACSIIPSSTPPMSIENEDDKFTLDTYTNHSEYRSNLSFLKILSGNRRYSNVELERSCAANRETVQFAAVTFVLPYKDEGKDIRVITFRGTNGTLVGWKEDFYFALNKDTPDAKRKAVNYLSTCIEQCPSSRFVITGHSKGGHLAVYSFYKYIGMKWFDLMWSSSNPNSSLKDKFYKTKKGKSVLNFDGPGIKEGEKKDIEDTIKDDDFLFENYEKIVAVYAPSLAIVSVLLGQSCKKEEWFYVSSNARGVYQHSLCSWIVTDNYDFLRGGEQKAFSERDRDEFSEFIEETVKKFLSKYSKDEEQKKFRKFIDIVFLILDDKIDQMITLPEKERFMSYIEKYIGIPDHDKTIFKEVLRTFLNVIQRKIKLIDGKKEHKEISRYLAIAKALMIILDSPGALEAIRGFSRDGGILNLIGIITILDKLLSSLSDEEKKIIMSLL